MDNPMTQLLNKTYHDIDNQYYLKAFKRYPIVLERGQGAHVWDIEGNEYIDALAGIAVNSVGHCHPTVVAAIREQSERLIHISNFYLSKPQAELSEKLAKLSGLKRVFFTNSGSESVEGAFKIARKYAHSIGRGGTILSFEGCFHGRTLATIAAGKKQMQKGFAPIPAGFKQLPFNDMTAVRNTADKETAAIIIEPIQGEGGINVADKTFLTELSDFCRQENIVLIFDEIQCGMGRTGKLFAGEHFGIKPDIMTLAKALGGGVPIGAVLSSDKIASAIKFGDHGTTFGGNPLACATALAVLRIIEDEQLLKQVGEKSVWLKEQINNIKEPSIKEVRGLGLMIGIEFNFETKPLVLEMLHRGVLANSTVGNILRLVPPLNIDYEDLEKIMDVIKKSIKAVKNNE